MTTTELVKLLKKCPTTADVYFDDLKGGLITIGQIHVATPKEKVAAGRNPKKPAVVLTDNGSIG